MTFERALQIRHLARMLPDDAIVLETDAPDIVPQWLYLTAAQAPKGDGAQRARAVAGIAQSLADLRGLSLQAVAQMTAANTRARCPGWHEAGHVDAPGPARGLGPSWTCTPAWSCWAAFRGRVAARPAVLRPPAQPVWQYWGRCGVKIW